MTPLRQRMIDDLRIRNYSRCTINNYIRLVARFAEHFERSPERLGPEHIRDYQLHLLANETSWGIFNQTVAALRFLSCDAEAELASGPIALREETETVTVRAEPAGSVAVPRRHHLPETPNGADNSLRRRPARLGSRCSSRAGHRQRSDAPPRPAREGAKGRHRTPVGGIAQVAASLLADISAESLAVSRAEAG